MKRKRGGQAGNRNALKHGFYSDSFKQREGELLASEGNADFEGEVDLLRVLIKRTMDKANEQEDLTLDENLSILRTVSFASMVLERLSRSKHWDRFEVRQEPHKDG